MIPYDTTNYDTIQLSYYIYVTYNMYYIILLRDVAHEAKETLIKT